MLKSCTQCGKIFEDLLGKYSLCPNCRQDEETLLRKVKDYLWTNPGTTEAKLWEMFGVSHKQIMKWLRDQRIEVTPGSAIKLTCQRCGSMITTGKYCKDCNTKIANNLHELQAALMPREERNLFSMVIDKNFANHGSMHFLQNAEEHRKPKKDT